ncbi:MAG: restriction endonuclease subunit S [Chitinophaga sp.]|uniref:restriction endonuclease subunit S n=1 Tax=Chitinophaga sp. TaxID=1869181 RepID=UPI0025BE0533|nr:restriction endonuclease subunit S [Chitinophaga sp.]MBV8255564.1 restriction endonuclease subunit S [Chitinophaga sp.]
MRKYDKYKDSGIEWAGLIPEHWDVKKISYCFAQIGSGTTPAAGESEYYDNGSFNWLQTGDLDDSEIWYTSKRITSKALDDYPTLRTYPVDSLVIAMYGATIGRTGILKIESTTNQACCVLAKPQSIDYKFAFYWLNSVKEHVISLSYGGGQPNINQEQVRNLKIHLPTIIEQINIVNYLDRKTNDLDALIADKKKLIDLYVEEKTTIINEAITKGINPKMEMKDSYVNYLGNIPCHWEIKKIGHCSTIVRGASPRPSGDPRFFLGNFIHWITVKEVTNANGKFVESTEEFLTEEGSKLSRIINPETLLLSNSGATLGVPKISKIRGCINDGSVAFISFKSILLRDFLYYFFFSHTQIYREEMKGNGQPNLNTDIIKSTLLALPPIEEQQLIINHIESECTKIEAKIIQTKKLISLLIEYRLALINQVITGKVKVND